MLSALFFRGFILLIRWTPLWLIYFLSDILAWILQYIIGYRNQTIRENLLQAYPDMDKKTLKKTIKEAYKNLTDTSLESFKGPYLAQKELKKRMHFKNPELLPKNSNVVLIGGHQGNWEWGGLAVTLWFEQAVAGVYKPLRNKKIDQYFREIREKWGLRLLSMRESFRFLAQKNPPTILVLIADQSPGNAKTAYWTNFYNKMSAFNIGPEKIAKSKNWPVYFYQVKRVKRGFYEVDFYLLEEKSAESNDGVITARYRDALEKAINEQPGSWLWSHKRWKKTMPPGVKQV